MADTFKVLGQLNPSASSLTALYTAPPAGTATVSSFVACNQGASSATFRMSVAVAAATDDAKQYVYYDLSVNAKDTFAATLGLTLGPGDVVRVYASSNTMSFAVFGVEVT